MQSIEVGITDLDSDMMDPKDMLLWWYNWPPPTLYVWKIQSRYNYFLYLTVWTSLYMEGIPLMYLHIFQDHLLPPLYSLMNNFMIVIDTNLEIIFIGTRFLLYWKTYKLVRVQVESGKPSSTRSGREWVSILLTMIELYIYLSISLLYKLSTF